MLEPIRLKASANYPQDVLLYHLEQWEYQRLCSVDLLFDHDSMHGYNVCAIDEFFISFTLVDNLHQLSARLAVKFLEKDLIDHNLHGIILLD